MAKAKYSSDDLKDMLAKGQAMKNATGDPSYPIADEEDLEKAIKAVGRGAADHDSIRKHIIGRAKALKLTSKIPDNWNADGSLSTEKARWFAPSTRDERRATSMSFGDIQTAVYNALQGALQAKFPDGSPVSSYFDVWICDLGADWLIFQSYERFPGTGTFRVGYSIDTDGAVTFEGDPEQVTPVTSWQPVQTNASDPSRERRADKVTCKTCTGTGKIREGHVTCPDCKGTGKVDPDVADTSMEGSSGRPRHRPRRQKRSLDRLPEFRTFRTQFERRVAQDGNDIILTGYPIRYNATYQVRDFAGVFRETMHPGVADAVMESRDFDCRFLENHEGRPHARTANGTLLLSETSRGVRSEVHLDGRRQDSNDLAMAVERSTVTQMSCGFVVATDEWNIGDDGIEERDVFSFAELFDVSAVTYPASPTTSIELTERMLAQAAVESRERIRRLHVAAGAVRSGSPLSQKDGEDLRAAAEALYRVDHFAPIPELLDAWGSVADRFVRVFRAGKVLSNDNQADIEAALEALHAADDIDIPGITKSLETIDKALDDGQEALARVLGRADPDGDANDKNPTLVPPKTPKGDDDARARQLQHLKLVQLSTV